MAGSVKGGKLAAKTNKEKYGANFYSEIGRRGGRASGTGGFYADPERAKLNGSIGGKKSRRTWTPEQRKAHGEAMKRFFARKDFQTGFNKPTKLDKLKGRFHAGRTTR